MSIVVLGVIYRKTKAISTPNVFLEDSFILNESYDLESEESLYYFIEGLGGPYYEKQTLHSTGGVRGLQYYKKGEETWGKRQIVTGLVEQVNKEDKCIS